MMAKKLNASKIPKRIASIKFGLMPPNEIRRLSAVEVKTADTFKDDGHAYHQGLMDPQMGVIERGIRCETCGNLHDECPSHFGHIQLELPVIHCGFTKLIKTALKTTCTKCHRALLHENVGTHPTDIEKSEQDYYRDRVMDILKKHGPGSPEFKKIVKDIEKECAKEKRKVCMHCGSENGKIILEKPTVFKEKKADKSERKLNPRDIREWLEGIPGDDLIFIGMDKESNRPEWVVMRVLPVPPITVRPSITLESGDRSEDDLTHKLVDVLRINQRLRENRDQGAPQLIVEDLWELLQYHITTYFDNQTSGIPPARHRSGRPLKTLTQRLKGKEGRFRSNLSGKRVNFCARSVISPDPALGINEVGVPVQSAKVLTVPIRVTRRNREQLREMILRGPDRHPGVNYIVRNNDRRVKITDRTKYINAGFRCLNPECSGGDAERGEEYTGMAKELNEVLKAPNFLPGMAIRQETRKRVEGLMTEWVVDLESTIANLRGEDANGKSLPADDPRAIIHRRWVWEQENPDEPFPEELDVTCPHCGSPWDEDGEYRTDCEDRLSTIDLDGRPKAGMIVERHLIDGDVVIFNRQPSLHRMSMMMHEVRVMPGKTFRFNLSVCTPYNADFDGDEMNLHIIQSEEARAEAKILMRVQENILSPRYGGAVIGGIHDHISGAYLLTHSDTVIPFTQAIDVMSKIGWVGEMPATTTDEKGVEGYLGRDLLNLILPADINLSYKSRSKDQVEVVNGNVISGTIDKTGIGAEDGKLLDAVVQTHGSTRGAKFLDDMTNLTIGICTALGFTTGIDDEDLPPAAHAEIERINVKACADVDEKLELFGKSGRGYEARPGRTPLETLEEDIMLILDTSRSRSGEIAKEHLASDNAAVMMAVSGARGSMDNLSMMAGSIGQTRVRGQRLERGYKNRVLSHFRRDAKGAREKGFVSSSFKRGLEPTEFFMLSVSGRESLVDTAVRTSKSGYMQRRLINAMDDLKVTRDLPSSVRNTADRIIQFSYGEDGVDPTHSIRGEAVNIRSVLDKAIGGGN